MRTPFRLSGISLLLLFLAFSTTAFSDDTRPILTDKDQVVLGLLPIVSPERLAWPGFVAAKHMEYGVFSSFAAQIGIE